MKTPIQVTKASRHLKRSSERWVGMAISRRLLKGTMGRSFPVNKNNQLPTSPAIATTTNVEVLRQLFHSCHRSEASNAFLRNSDLAVNSPRESPQMHQMHNEYRLVASRSSLRRANRPDNPDRLLWAGISSSSNNEAAIDSHRRLSDGSQVHRRPIQAAGSRSAVVDGVAMMCLRRCLSCSDTFRWTSGTTNGCSRSVAGGDA